jgi:membrane protease YdiL (CAAX protease family)
MISLKNVKTVFKKEFLQAMRDKSVLFTNFFVPLFGLPLYFLFVLEAANYAHKKEQLPLKDDTVFQVSYQGDLSTELFHQLKTDKKISLKKIQSSVTEDQISDYREKFKKLNNINDKRGKFKKRLKQKKEDRKKINLEYFSAKKDANEALEKIKNNFGEGSHLHLAIFKNESNVYASYFFYGKESQISRAALKYVTKIFNTHEKEMIKIYHKEKDIQHYHLNPIHIWELNLDKDDSTALEILGIGIGGGILFLLLISIFNPAINTTLVERDQNTYKVLLMNPVSLHEIFLGKYFNVALQGLLALTPYFIEFLVVYAWGGANALFEYKANLNSVNLFLLVIGAISASIFISSFCFIACSFAKTRIQAQSLFTLMVFFLIIPIVTVGIMDIKLNNYTAFIPLISFPLSTESLMMPSPDYLSVVLSLISNFIYSLFLIWLSLGAFLVQWKGKSDTKSLSDLLTFKRRKSDILVPAHAFLAFAIAFLGYTYGGFLLQSFQIEILTFLFAPILFCLGTSLFITQYSGLDFTRVINWKGFSFKYFIKILLSAFCLNYILSLIMYNSTYRKIFSVEFPKIFETGDFLSGTGTFLLFALIPGIAEELLFRGIVFKGLRQQYNFKISMILSSILFAIIHFSMFKFGHTFILGLVLAYIYEKRGMFSCIIMHIVFNSFGLLFGLNPTFQSLISNVTNMQLILIIPPFVACSFAFIVISRRSLKISDNSNSLS